MATTFVVTAPPALATVSAGAAAFDVAVEAPYYYHSVAGSFGSAPGLRADTAAVTFSLPTSAAAQGLQTVEYRLQFSATEVVATGTVGVDPDTQTFQIPVAGFLTRADLHIDVTARGPAPAGAPNAPAGAGAAVGEVFSASATFSVYSSGPPTADPIALSTRSFIGSELVRYTTDVEPVQTVPTDVLVVTVPGDLREIHPLVARIGPDPALGGGFVEAAVSRTGDPGVAVVTIPADYFDTQAAGRASVVLGGYSDTLLTEYIVPVIMSGVPLETTVEILPDSSNSSTGRVEVKASSVSGEDLRIIVGPRSGAAVSDRRYSVAAGGSVSIPFDGVGYPVRLTVYDVERNDGDTESSTIVGEYAPAGPAAAKTEFDLGHPERSILYLDNRNQFGQNRFTGETLTRVFDVTVDGESTPYTLKGGATLHVPLKTAVAGTTVTVVVEGLTVLDQVVPSSQIAVPADRVTGGDRFAVSAAVSALAYPDGADSVVLVSGENFSDALSAAPLATHSGAPLLLTGRAELPAVVRDEIRRLSPTSVVVVGGPASVSEAVVSELKIDYDVERIDGKDRFDVSRNVAARWLGSTPETVYTATGRTFADALSAGAAAGARDVPVLLVDGSAATLDPESQALLRSLDPGSISIAGGPSSVSAMIEGDLREIAMTQRYGGADRFEASIAINSSAFTHGSDAFLVTGLNYPDALSAGAWSGTLKAPLYLSRTDCVPPAVINHMKSIGVVHATLVGGPVSLAPSVQQLSTC
jgi:putative cell wall-binding protein